MPPVYATEAKPLFIPAGCIPTINQFGNSPVNTENQLADKTAKEVAEKYLAKS